MCEYCEKEKTIVDDVFISRSSWGWGGVTKITISEAIQIKVDVFIDRGYLRMVDIDDCQCIDSGKKIKIKYCPFCGKEIATA